MQVSFQNTIEDLVSERRALGEHYGEAPAPKWSSHVVMLLCVGLLLAAASFGQPPLAIVLTLATSVVVVIDLVGLVRLPSFLTTRDRFEKVFAEQLRELVPREHLENLHRWTVSSAGFQMELLRNRTLVPWNAVVESFHEPMGLIVILPGDQFVLVPRRAADSATEWQLFVDAFQFQTSQARVTT